MKLKLIAGLAIVALLVNFASAPSAAPSKGIALLPGVENSEQDSGVYWTPGQVVADSDPHSGYMTDVEKCVA